MTRNLASFVLFAAVLSGQSAPASKPGKVEGVVINSVTNEPVKKAIVTLQALDRPATHTAVTDSAGHFHFDSVEPGKYQALANREGFIPPGMPPDPWSKPVAVAGEQQVKDLVVKLLPLGMVSGHVFDEDGDPVARVQVQALRYVYRQGDVRQLNPAGFASSNDLGEFQLLDLEPGRYYFLAAVPGRLARLPLHLRSGTPEPTYPDTFYPSATQAAQGTASHVAPGAHLTGIDFRVHKAPSYHIRGKAVDGRTGQPIHSATVLIRPRESVFFENTQIQPNGTFDAARVMSGSYLLIGQTREELSAQEIANVGDHDVDDVVLVFRPPFDISGTVRLEGAAPPAEHRGQMRVGMTAIERGSSIGAEVNADGSFALKITPAVYRISANCDAGAYPKSMHFGDQDVTGGRIDLTQQTGGALNIVCGTDVGQIQGSVQAGNGEPAAQVQITIAPDDEHQGRLDLYYQLTSDENGKFDYRDFAPGDYSIRLGDGRTTNAAVGRVSKSIRKPCGLGRCSPRRKCVSPIETDSGRRYRRGKEQAAMIRILLAAGIAAGILLAQEPPPRLSVAGMVINSTSGDPVKKALVILSAQDQNGISYTADSDANGRFLIGDVTPGTYWIYADRQGFMPEMDGAPGAPPPSFKVEAGQSLKDVKIKLIPLGVITGRVVDDDGDPVRGAQVEALAYIYEGGRRQLRNLEQVMATDKGEFRLFGLRPGTFYLRASGSNAGSSYFTSGPAMEGNRSPGSFTPTYFPGTTDSDHAAPIDVSVGAQLRGFDMRLRREMRYSVRGKLPELKQPSSQTTMLQLFPRGGRDQNFSFSLRQENDTFEFTDILPGSYIVAATILNEDKRSVARQAIEVVNADVEGVTLNFVPPIDVSGVVRVEGTPRRPGDKLSVTLQSETPAMFGQSGAEVKPDGSFVITDVMPNVYEITVGAYPGTYLKSIRFGDEEVPDGRVDLTKGSGPVTVLLAADVGEVEGSVKKSNGDAAARVQVTLIAYGKHLGRGDLSRSGFTDEQGKFHLRDVAPGEYKAFAWEDVPVGAPQDPEFRKPFKKQAAAVKMDPGGHETVELTAISVKADKRAPAP